MLLSGILFIAFKQSPCINSIFAIGCEPIEINSSLLSAQNRKRLYWTNIENIKQPQDKGLLLKDIVGPGYLTRAEIKKLDITKLNYGGYKSLNSQSRIRKNFRGIDEKANCLTASNSNNPAGCGCSVVVERGTNTWRKLTQQEVEQLQTLPDNYTKLLETTPGIKAAGNGWTVDVIAHIFKNL